ncbi:MAG TPA: hypothetical protein VLM11_00305 [Streptosporangiaceae bacterium]|nr:hypothetical protein [Streptosporangiaceae bacterium]
MSYQPYPTGGFDQLPQQGPATPPPSVRTAVKLMYAGAGVSALSFIIGLITIGSLRQAIIRASNKPLTNNQLHTAEAVGIAFIVLLGLIGVGLWLWMAWANGRGRNWARIVAAVLFGLNTLGLLSVVARPSAAGTKIFDIVGWLIGLGATIFLWRKDSSQYFTQSQLR